MHVAEGLEHIGDGGRRASLDLRVRASPEWLSQVHLAGICYNHVVGYSVKVNIAIGPKVVPFWGFIFRILSGNPKKELLWGLWVVSIDMSQNLYGK